MAIISIPSSFAGVSIPSNVFNPNSPLDLLYGGLGVKTYKYPSDLATSPSKSHYVQFSIKEIIPASYGGANGNTIPGQRVGLSNLGSYVSELTSMGAKGTGDSGGLNITNDDYGYDLPAAESSPTLFGEVFGFGEYMGDAISQGLQITPTTTQPKAVVSLYMPDTLTAQYNSTYDELQLTDIGSGINTIRTIDQLASRGNFGSLINAYTTGNSSGGLYGGTKNLAKQIGNIASTDPAAISLITGAMGNKQLGALLTKGAGYAINPQLQMIYRGIGLRSFQLSFTFTPNSQGEAEEVNYIIQQFKYHYAPTLLSAKEVSSDSMYLVPPSIFSVDFMIDGTENKFLPKYGDCVLTDIDVNYAPNGWASYDDGAPIQTTLTMSFKETEIMDKKKIQKGYKGIDGGLR